MGKRINIGATLTLNNGNFFTNTNKASQAAGKLGNSLKGVSGHSNTASSAAAKLGNSFKGMIGKMVGIGAVVAGLKATVDFGKQCIETANGQINAEARLEQLMSNVKGTTTEQIAGIKSYAAELQNLTTIGDEVGISGASQLATFQLQSDTIKKLMPALNDLAVGQHGLNVSQEQMIGSANLLGKVMGGQVGALSKAGVSFSAAQEKILKTGTEAQKAATLVEVLGQNFGGVAQKMAQTPEGRIQQFKNAWGDVQEMIGMRLYPAVTKVLGYFAQYIPKISAAVGPVFDKIGNYISGCINNFKPVLSYIKEAFFNLKDAVAGIFTGGGNDSVKTVLDTISNTVLPTLGNALGIAFNILAKCIKVATPLITGFMSFWTDLFTTIWHGWDSTVNYFKNMGTTIGNIFDKICDVVRNAWEKVKSFFKIPHIEVVGNVSIAGIDTPIPKFGLKWNAQGGILTKPTVFGMNGNTLLGGGEAGHEAILPLSVLWDKLNRFADKITDKGKEYVVNIYINGSNMNEDDVIRKMLPKLKLALNNM